MLIYPQGMLRDVLITYEQGGVSKFMEGGHPYHCLDYRELYIVLDHALKSSNL
jgi:hypothetical protein